MSSGIKGQRSDTGADKKCYALSGIRIREAIGVFLAFDLLTVAVKSGRIINFLEYNGPAHHTFDIRLLTAKAYFDPDVSTKHFSRILCDRKSDFRVVPTFIIVRIHCVRCPHCQEQRRDTG